MVPILLLAACGVTRCGCPTGTNEILGLFACDYLGCFPTHYYFIIVLLLKIQEQTESCGYYCIHFDRLSLMS